MQLFQPEADIYLNHLIQNYHAIREIAGNANIMAVIKANAYGHGAVPVARCYRMKGCMDSVLP